jgi:hypothetical protein
MDKGRSASDGDPQGPDGEGRTLLRWPASSRNGGRLQIGMVAGMKSEWVAGFDRNSHEADANTILAIMKEFGVEIDPQHVRNRLAVLRHKKAK